MQVSCLKKNMFVKGLILAGVTSLLAGCFDEDDKSVSLSPHYAVISTQSSNRESSDVSIISLKDYSADNTNYGGASDTSISTYGENFYLIGRFGTDNITKFHIDSPEKKDALWQFSASDEGEKSNPYKLVVKNENTAYLIRYGESTIWIVDPSVANSSFFEDFVVGEIDLSSYTADDSDNTPEAADALLIDNKLYVMMQNLDAAWVPGAAYIAVFDTEDNHVEIETNIDSTTPKGITLKVTNPSTMEYLSMNDTLYISGAGLYGSGSNEPDYAGGIERIDLSDYSSQIIVDDGGIYGQTTNIAILNSARGYFIGYNGAGLNDSGEWESDTTIYSFNPTTGIVDTTALMENIDVSDIEIGPLGNLWVTNRNESGITIIDTVDNSVFKELIDTDLLPNDIEFISRTEN